jgi:UDP-N-acetylglucosamine acyltransferase
MKGNTPHDNNENHLPLNGSYGLKMFDGYTKNVIHPTAIIGKDVVLGSGNYIGAFSQIVGKTIIGDNNHFEAYCSVGTEPEHKDYFGKENMGVYIGNNNRICEFTTISAGCEIRTMLQNNITILRGSYIGHDSIISDDCTISCNALLGGHSFIGKGANIGMGAILHQYSQIGAYAMIGMGAIITKKVKVQSFGMYVGNPAKYIKENDYQKKKFTYEQILQICIDYENGFYKKDEKND